MSSAEALTQSLSEAERNELKGMQGGEAVKPKQRRMDFRVKTKTFLNQFSPEPALTSNLLIRPLKHCSSAGGGEGGKTDQPHVPPLSDKMP